jgi:hypothetical protein
MVVVYVLTGQSIVSTSSVSKPTLAQGTALAYTEIARFTVELDKVVDHSVELDKVVDHSVELAKVLTMTAYVELEDVS